MNTLNTSILQQIVLDNAHYAAENGENIANYFLMDFDAAPESWDVVFSEPYDSLNIVDRLARREMFITAFGQNGKF